MNEEIKKLIQKCKYTTRIAKVEWTKPGGFVHFYKGI